MSDWSGLFDVVFITALNGGNRVSPVFDRNGGAGGRSRARRRTHRGAGQASQRARSGTPSDGRLNATSAGTARVTQRRHGVTVVSTGQAVQDEVDRVAHVEDRLRREQFVADPVSCSRVLGMSTTRHAH